MRPQLTFPQVQTLLAIYFRDWPNVNMQSFNALDRIGCISARTFNMPSGQIVNIDLSPKGIWTLHAFSPEINKIVSMMAGKEPLKNG